MARRYYLPDDPDRYVTPSQLKRTGREKQIKYLTHWFHGLFWDPAQETPYNSREGGYLYIWGGPYDANDELREEFEGNVSEEAILAAIEEVESDGTYDWAPSPNHPDMEAAHEEAMARELDEPILPSLGELRSRIADGVKPQFGDAYESGKWQKLKSEITDLRELIEGQRTAYGGIGHNNPPAELAVELVELDELDEHVAGLDQELEQPQPDLNKIVEKASWLESFLSWGAKKLDLAIDAFVKRLGDVAAVGLGIALLGDWEPIWAKINRLCKLQSNGSMLQRCRFKSLTQKEFKHNSISPAAL